MAQKPYAAMQNLLKDQTAAAQLMKQAAQDLATAAHELALNSSVEVGPNADKYTDRGSGPNGGRPKVGDNQTSRPSHDRYSGGSHPGKAGAGDHSAGKGIAGIRNAVSNQIHNRVGLNSGSTFTKTFDDAGNHTGYTEHKSDGSNVARTLGEPGLEADVASAATRSGISRVAGAFAGSGATGALKAVPYVGEGLMAAEAGHEVLTQVGKQRQANSQYQSIYGGSNVGTGVSNRLDQKGFQLGQLFSGGLTSSQSNQAFEGVSAMGFQGSQRSSDLNFISSNYKSMGMDVSSSLQLITTASKNLNTDLSGLATQLKSVSAAAKETGQNAGTARAAFTQTYGQISQASPGTMASPIAGAISTVQTGLGRSMSNVNLSGSLTSLTGQSEIAGLLGQSLPQFNSTMLNNPGQTLQGVDKLTAQIFAPFLTPQVTAAIDAAVSAAGGAAVVKANPDIIGNSILPQIAGMVNGTAILAAANAQNPGLGLTSGDQAIELMIQQYLGNTNTSQAFAQQAQSSQQNPGIAQQALNKASASQQNLNKAVSSSVSAKSAQNTAYQTKGVNPVIDQAKNTLKGQYVRVDTAGGPRVVTLDEAIKDYTDQVAKGTATVMSGDSAGQTVQQALGGMAETNYTGNGSQYNKAGSASTQVGAGGTSSGSAGSVSGETVDAFTKAQAKKANDKSSGTVTIQGSAALIAALNMTASGNVTVATTAASQGTTPVPGQPTGN